MDKFAYLSRAAAGAGAGAHFHRHHSLRARSAPSFFGHDIYLGIADLNIGILALFAITALSVYGVALAGWSSNSKYPLLGGLRSSAQMVSYELALTMSVVGVLLMAGSFSLRDIIAGQAQPKLRHFSAGTFSRKFSASFASSSPRSRKPIACPSILPEAESELVAGFHTEYASFKFAMFFIAEYTSMITVSCLCSILFFGGWLSPFPATWTFTHYLPSLILIPFGLWVIWDGIRYETIFGRIILARPWHGHRRARRDPSSLFPASTNSFRARSGCSPKFSFSSSSTSGCAARFPASAMTS